jgi:EmrB/QacA subfamily drug resistance transporter
LPPVDRRAWIALGVATLAGLLTTIDISIVNVAFPSMRRDLGATEAGLSWVLSGYSIAAGAFLMLAGRLADQKGRRRLFMIGVTVFVAGSFLSGMASTTEWLIAARVLQGVGGSILGPSSLAMILPEFPGERRSMVIGIWGASAALGAALGPSIGALLIDATSWRWIFFVNVPVGALILVLTPRFVRESSDPDARGGFDVVGVPAGTLGVALVLLAVVEGERWGYLSARSVGSVLVGLTLIVLLFVRSARHPSPLIDLSLIRIRSFWSAGFGQIFFITAFIATILFHTLLLQELWGWSVLAAGFGVVPGPALAAILGGPVGSIVDRVGHRNVVVFGSLMAAINPLWLMSTVGPESSWATTLLPAQLCLGVAVSCSFATYASFGLRDVPAARFATASAMLRTLGSIGFASGIAISIAVFSSARHLGPLVAFDRVWTFLFCTFLTGAAFCAVACPGRVRQPVRA